MAQKFFSSARFRGMLLLLSSEDFPWQFSVSTSYNIYIINIIANIHSSDEFGLIVFPENKKFIEDPLTKRFCSWPTVCIRTCGFIPNISKHEFWGGVWGVWGGVGWGGMGC